MVCQVIAMNIHVELENENKCSILSHYTKLEKALEISMLAYDEALAKEDKLILSLFLYNICLSIR